MFIEVDLATVPPTTTLREADDFTALKVVVLGADDAFVAPDVLIALAGERAADPAWQRDLDGMLAYAGKKGWLREDGAIQAHVEQADRPA